MKTILLIICIIILYSCDNDTSREWLTQKNIKNEIETKLIIEFDSSKKYEQFTDTIDDLICIRDSTGKKIYRNGKLILDDKYYLYSPGTLDSFEIDIQADFDKDRLQLFFDSTLIYDDTVSTDDCLGFSGSFKMKKVDGLDSIGIKLNNNSIIKEKVFENCKIFDFINISRGSGEFKVTFTNRVNIYL